MRAFCGAFVLFLALAGEARAGAPNLITYQGRLKETGLPVTGNRSADILLCPGATGGGCFSSGAQTVSVSNGLFRSTFSLPSGVALESGPWYLEVSVGGTPLAPREQFGSSAYALYASSASTLIADPGSGEVRISTRVSIAASSFSVGGSTLAVLGGKVGIGTANPAATLEVVGSVLVSGGGHARLSGVPPTAGAGCGAGATVSGSDGGGRVTLGAAPAASCMLTFNSPWTPNPPVCHFNNDSRVQFITLSAGAVGSVTFTSSGTVLNAGDGVSYLCLGY